MYNMFNNYGSNSFDNSNTFDIGFPTIDVFGSENVSINNNNNDDYYCNSLQPLKHKMKHYDNRNSKNTTTNCETGIIEKLLRSYGFIQCCEREARLFFHFSQFVGIIDHLKVGDTVEFDVAADGRTGKPIAHNVSKIVPDLSLIENRVLGIVATEPGLCDFQSQGMITYENKGECIFLPYEKCDVEGHVTLRVGNKVSFMVAQNNRGNLNATHVRMEDDINPVKYRGVVCSADSSDLVYGSIERADVVKEIFFHNKHLTTFLKHGDDVEFNIEMDRGREIAININKLPKGSVIFEDVSDKVMKGQILKPVDQMNRYSNNGDALAGRLKYRSEDYTEVELPFGLTDQEGCFTLFHGDWVEFKIATDRRDKVKKAVSIRLLEESFNVSGERRERGCVAFFNNDIGYIYPVDKDIQVTFMVSELLTSFNIIEIGDEVEFTITQRSSFSFPSPRKVAIRIRKLQKGSVVMDNLVHADIRGLVTKLPGFLNPGLITYQSGGIRCTASVYENDLDSDVNLGDEVSLKLYQIIRNKELVGRNVKKVVKDSRLQSGWIISIKNSYGFIEMASFRKSLFFNLNDVNGDAQLTVGSEVEFVIAQVLAGKTAIDIAKGVKLKHFTQKILSPMLEGTVKRTSRAQNPGQKEYTGLIERDHVEYEFGVISLKYKCDIIQVGDLVTFQVNHLNQAFNVVSTRDIKKCVISDITPGKIGFLSSIDQNVPFNLTEMYSKYDIEVGDELECALVKEERTGKLKVCQINLLTRREKTGDDQENRKAILTRQPLGSNGKKRGFVQKKKRIPFCKSN